MCPNIRYLHYYSIPLGVARWRCEEMSLLEYLRKSDGNTGAIARWLRKQWQKDSAGQAAGVPLEAFANAYTMQGEQIVAADYLWRLNDGYYGQWCMMNLPFRALDGFRLTEVQDKVPVRYRWLATAVVLTDDPRLPPALRGYWRDPSRIQSDMEQEADTGAYIEDVLGFVATQILAIDRYLSGQLDRREEPAPAPRGPRQAGHQEDAFELEGKQALLYREVAQRVQRGMKLQAAASDESGTLCVQRLRLHRTDLWFVLEGRVLARARSCIATCGQHWLQVGPC